VHCDRQFKAGPLPAAQGTGWFFDEVFEQTRDPVCELGIDLLSFTFIQLVERVVRAVCA
jgi:hypothetical protein